MAKAIDLADAFGATLNVLHVVDAWRYDTSIESAVAPLGEEGEAYVDWLAYMAADADVSVATAVEVGRPAHYVLEYADANDVDHVVMGTRGRGGLPRRLRDSVTDYVVTHAAVPVHVGSGAGRSGKD